MRRQCSRIALILAVGFGLVLAGCNLTRQGYEAVSVGQAPDEVKKALGAPRYQFEAEWVWTNDDPRDLTKVTVRFDADKKVVGKSWQNPEKPWENHREGQ